MAYAAHTNYGVCRKKKKNSFQADFGIKAKKTEIKMEYHEIKVQHGIPLLSLVMHMQWGMHRNAPISSFSPSEVTVISAYRATYFAGLPTTFIKANLNLLQVAWTADGKEDLSSRFDPASSLCLLECN